MTTLDCMSGQDVPVVVRMCDVVQSATPSVAVVPLLGPWLSEGLGSEVTIVRCAQPKGLQSYATVDVPTTRGFAGGPRLPIVSRWLLIYRHSVLMLDN